MAIKADFTSEEWTTLRDAPDLAAAAVTVAGTSGLIGTLEEAFSTVSALAEGCGAMRSRAPSVRERDRAAQGSVRSNRYRTGLHGVFAPS